MRTIFILLVTYIFTSHAPASIYSTPEALEEGCHRGAEPRFAGVGVVVVRRDRGDFSCNALILDSSHILMPYRGMQFAKAAEFHFLTPEGIDVCSALHLEYYFPIRPCGEMHELGVFTLAKPVESFTKLEFFDEDITKVSWKNAFMVSVGKASSRGRPDDVRLARHLSVCEPRPAGLIVAETGDTFDFLSCEFVHYPHRLAMVPFPGDFGSPILVLVDGTLKVAGVFTDAIASLPDDLRLSLPAIRSTFEQKDMFLQGTIIPARSFASRVSEILACMAGDVD